MRKIQDVLIPMRFSTLMLQIIFSMVALFMREPKDLINPDKTEKTILCVCILFYIFEFAELVIILTGVTLFQNKLSLVQIFLHMLATALFGWYIFNNWKGKTLWGIWTCGSLIPILLECGGIFFTYLFYRKVLRLN